MKRIGEQLRQLIAQNGYDWQVKGSTVIVPVGTAGRKQRVSLHRDGDDYVLSSVILGAQEVTATDARWRDLARRTWRWNAEQEVVTFCFDDDDRLIAQARHPAEYLDPVELELYVQAIANASDRLEYMLTGADEH